MRLTDTTGTVVWALDSTPFDAIHGAFGLPNEDVDLNGTSITYNARFPGQYFDAETGLNYNYFRDYDPGTGRYIQSDPIGLAVWLNTYGYVGGNPLSAIDPFGLQTANPLTNVCARDPFHPAKQCSAGAAGHASGAATPLAYRFGACSVVVARQMRRLKNVQRIRRRFPTIGVHRSAKAGNGKERGQPESGKGNRVNPETGQKIHPDAHHLPPKGPHWGLTNPDGTKWD